MAIELHVGVEADGLRNHFEEWNIGLRIPHAIGVREYDPFFFEHPLQDVGLVEDKVLVHNLPRKTLLRADLVDHAVSFIEPETRTEFVEHGFRRMRNGKEVEVALFQFFQKIARIAIDTLPLYLADLFSGIGERRVVDALQMSDEGAHDGIDIFLVISFAIKPPQILTLINALCIGRKCTLLDELAHDLYQKGRTEDRAIDIKYRDPSTLFRGSLLTHFASLRVNLLRAHHMSSVAPWGRRPFSKCPTGTKVSISFAQ